MWEAQLQRFRQGATIHPRQDFVLPCGCLSSYVSVHSCIHPWHLQTYAYTYDSLIYAFLHVSVYMFIEVCKCTCYSDLYIPSCICLSIHLSIYSSIHAYVPTYVRTYIHIHYITLHYITLHYITLHYITLHYITLHYITLHYITLHYITLHYITLHYIFPEFFQNLSKPSLPS